MTDLEQVTRMADELLGGRLTSGGVTKYDPTAEELLAYTQKVEQAVLITRDEELEAEKLMTDVLRKQYLSSRAEIESLQAKLAMQTEAQLEFVTAYNSGNTNRLIVANENSNKVLNANQADVDKFMAKRKAEVERELLESLATDIDLNIGEKFYYLAEVVVELKRMAKERGGVK